MRPAVTHVLAIAVTHVLANVLPMSWHRTGASPHQVQPPVAMHLRQPRGSLA